MLILLFVILSILLFSDLPWLHYESYISFRHNRFLGALICIGYGYSLILFPESAMYSVDILGTKKLAELGLIGGTLLVLLGLFLLLIYNRVTYVY